MIPKIIHYCWFGGTPIPDKLKKNIKSWKVYFPEYKIQEWNENNFDVSKNAFARKAYNQKKWAFVADYVRLYVLVKYGGLYFDTDVEVITNFENLLTSQAVVGFETNNQLCTAVLASEPNFFLFKEWLHLYDDSVSDLMSENEPNVIPFTKLCEKNGLKLNGQFQIIKNLKVFPIDVFSPKDYRTGRIIITSNTVTIHHFSDSWHTFLEQKMHRRLMVCRKLFGNNFGEKIGRIINIPTKIHNKINKKFQK